VTAAELSCCHSTLNNKQACSLVGQLVKSQIFFLLVGGGPQLVEAPGPWPLWPMPKSGPDTAADFVLDVSHVIKHEKVALDRLRVRQNVFLVS